MRHLLEVIGIAFAVTLLTSCTASTGPATAGPDNDGYTVGYGYAQDQVSYGIGDYVGYGGWASNYYSPRNRYGYWPSTYNNGVGVFR